MVTLKGSKWAFGTAKCGHFRGGGQLRGVVNLEGFHLVINVWKKVWDRGNVVTLEGWST